MSIQIQNRAEEMHDSVAYIAFSSKQMFILVKYIVTFTITSLLLQKKNGEMVILAIEDIFQYLQSKSVWSTTRCLTLEAIHMLFDLLLETFDGTDKRVMTVGTLVMLQATFHKC